MSTIVPTYYNYKHVFHTLFDYDKSNNLVKIIVMFLFVFLNVCVVQLINYKLDLNVN